ncbi:MAG: VCBS repeat-containing protein, partial [Planctomycetota bacterium]
MVSRTLTRWGALLVACACLLPLARTLPAADCNGNGTDDDIEIGEGALDDCDGDGVPDTCESFPPRFGLRTAFAPSSPIISQAIGDFDGDGVLDFVARLEGNTLFASFADDAPLKTPVFGVAAGDVTGDGRTDLIVQLENRIVRYPVDAKGVLGEAVVLVERIRTAELFAVDIDGDGAAELMTVSGGRGRLHVDWNDGSGEFAGDVGWDHNDTQTPIAVDLYGDSSLEIAVLDDDADLFLLGVTRDGITQDRRVEGDGVGFSLIVSALGDEVELAWVAGRQLRTLPNAGDLESTVRVLFQGDRGTFTQLSATDLDGDGDRDFLIGFGNASREVFCMYRGEEVRVTPTFVVDAPLRFLDFVENPVRDADLWLTYRGIARVDIFDRAGGEFPFSVPAPPRERTIVPLSDRFEPHTSALADFDGDGDLDVATIDGEDRIMILPNVDGRPVEGDIYSMDGTSELVSITAGDFDDDGHPDVAGVDEQLNVLVFLRGIGDGTFEQTDENYDIGNRSTYVESADFNEDGLLDIITVISGSGRVEVFIQRENLDFRDPVIIDVGQRPWGCATADFDDDGNLDFAVTNTASLSLSVVPGNGDGTFGEAVDYEIGAATFLHTDDLDGDGDFDLVAAKEGQQRLTILVNQGDGSFEVLEDYQLQQNPNSVRSGDFDGDGVPELVTGNEQNDSVSILKNLGDWVYDQRNLDVGVDPRFVAIGDLDDDDELDILVANHTSYEFDLIFPAKEVSSSLVPFVSSVCTEFGAFELSERIASIPLADDSLRYLLPQNARTPIVDESVFVNANVYESFAEFLRGEAEELFGDSTDEELEDAIAKRGVRDFIAGRISRVLIDGDWVYGFDVMALDEDPLPEPGEIQTIYETLARSFEL